jgi:hypothetical protein
LPEPEIIITHESDLDGLVSGLLLRKLAKKLYGKEPTLKAFHYQYWNNYPLREKTGWICDLSFEPRMDKPGWLIVDHHQFEGGAKNAKLVHDTGKSAGLLAWELCKENGMASEKLDRLVHLSNVIDLFIEDDPDFLLASDYGALVKSYHFWNLHSIIEGDLENLLDHPFLKVVQTRREVEDPIGFEWSRQSLEKVTPQLAYAPTVVGNTNAIVHRILKEDGRFPVIVTMQRQTGGPVTLSFRSRNGEALEIARRLQGGGHPNACGACLPKTIHHIPDALDYLKKTLNPRPAAASGGTGVAGLFDAIEDQ